MNKKKFKKSSCFSAFCASFDLVSGEKHRIPRPEQLFFRCKNMVFVSFQF